MVHGGPRERTESILAECNASVMRVPLLARGLSSGFSRTRILALPHTPYVLARVFVRVLVDSSMVD